MSSQETVEDKWIQKRILRTQHDEIIRIVKHSSGFSSPDDFIRAAIREKIERWNK